MIEELYHFFMAFFRVMVYFAIASTSFLIFISYKKAYCNEKTTWIIQSVMYLFLALAFSFAFYTIAGLTNLIEGVGSRYRFLVSLLGFTNIPLLIALMNFLNASLFQNGQKERVSGGVSENLSDRKRSGENAKKKLPQNNSGLSRAGNKKKSFGV